MVEVAPHTSKPPPTSTTFHQPPPTFLQAPSCAPPRHAPPAPAASPPPPPWCGPRDRDATRATASAAGADRRRSTPPRRPARSRASRRGSCASAGPPLLADRKSTRLNSSHMSISYAVFCLKKKTTTELELALA